MRGEYVFYTDLRPDLDLRSPRSYGAAFDARSYRSIVLLEDLTAQGWTFPDPLTLTISRADAEDMVSQLARYHGPLWDSPRLASLDGLRTSEKFQLDLNRTVGFDKRVDAGITRAQAVLPASIWRRRREVWPAVMRSLAINVTGPQTLLHQDLHPGNWLRDPEGRMGLYDWQCVGTGGWAVDYSYALTGLATDDRRAWERDLLALYLDELAGHGVPDPPSPDEAWKAYRQQPFHALAFGLFNLGRGMLQPRMQPDDYTRAAIQRIAQTVEDLESLDALD
jgi:hypothetical protein